MRTFALRLTMMVVISFILITTCKKPDDTTKLEITDITVTDNSVKISGKITSLSDNAISDFGVCYATTGSPVATDTAVRLGVPRIGNFSTEIKNLKRNKTYYFRAYIKEGETYLYDDVRSADIEAIVAAATTKAATAVTETTGTLNGSVNPNGISTAVSFEYGLTDAYGSSVSASQGSISGSTASDVSATISELTPNTSYHFRVKATNIAGTVYGADITFTTGAPAALPTATSNEATLLTNTTATLNGQVNANGSSTTVTFDYGTTFLYGSSVSATPATVTGLTPTGISAALTGLVQGQLYHFRVKAVSQAGTVYGEDLTFTTTNITVPALTTLEASLITSTLATSGGTITNDGGAEVTDRGVCWGTSENPTKANSSISNGTGIGLFVSNITGLTPSTQYYIRAWATNSMGTGYGEQVTFTTLSTDPVPPSLTTAVVTDIAATSATGGGTVNSDGGGTVIARGICYNTASNPTIDDMKTINGTGSGAFSSPFTGLAPSTTYYVRAYATNQAGTAYGNEVSFISLAPPATLPEVVTVGISGQTSSSASSGGNVTSDGGGTVSARGVCWSTSENPTVDGSKTINGSGTGIFSSSITGLSPSTIYFVRAYATNSAGTAYGDQVSFTTDDPVGVLATLTTVVASGITSVSASAGGDISNDGGSAVTARGVCWSTASNPLITDSKTTDGTGTGGFLSSITGLAPNTKYYIRAYATNSAGVAYGNELNFTTSLPDPVLPTVTTTDISDKTHNSATGGGNVTNDGYATVTARGICWSINPNPTIADPKTSNGTGTGSFVSSITGLSANTVYYVRAFATNSAGTAYGNQVTFTSAVLPYVIPTLTTTAESSLTYNSATTGGTISADGGSPVTARGVCYGTASNPTIAGNLTSNGSGTGTFVSNLVGLSASTTYYIRAYATNAAGTAYGNQITFTTLPQPGYPVITTTAVTGIGSTTATSGGNVTSNGGAPVTAQGVCWSTLANPTTADSKIPDGLSTTGFSSTITGLLPCTTYHVRAYATNLTGTAYGADLVFNTLAVLPSISTVTASSVTQTTASSGGTITGSCMSGVTVRGVCWSTSTSPTTALPTKTTDGTGGGSYTSSITGLTPCTTYYVRSYATNSAGTVYGNEISFTTSTSLPTLTTTTISGITSITASSGGNITGNCTTGITARGIVWSTSSSPTVDLPTKTTNGTGGGSYSSSMTGLIPCTVYYVRAYATNPAGTAYGNQLSFTTSAEMSTVTTTAISSITSSTAYSGGNVSGNCTGGVTARGICWSTSTGPTVALATKTVNGTGSGAYSSYMSSLTRATTYYVRAYATNSAGTSYGQEVSFTTLANLATISASSITIISATGTYAGGSISNDGGAAITERGVCWSSSTAYPTIADTKTSDGTGTGTFTSYITGLTAGTTYYLRAYATNSAGTAYSPGYLSFTVPATLTDADFNSYNTVSINGQTWMQENLRVTKYEDGTNLMQYGDTSSYSWSYYHSYQNNASYGSSYGYLYNGYVVAQSRDICPLGWHLPSITEWNTLASFLGGTGVAGGKMKDVSGRFNRFTFTWIYNYWNSPVGDNSSMFSGRGGGYYIGGFNGLKDATIWWSSTSKRYVRLDSNSTVISGISSTLSGTDEHFFYIRCKKD